MTLRNLAVIFLVMVVGNVSVAQNRNNLPTALGDRDFWRLFTEFSEPDGPFPDENYVSNERSYQRAIPRLRDSITAGGVYIGVGPEQNFTYISALQPRMAFVIDIRRQNAMELLMYKALFEMSSDRSDFVSRLFSLPRPEKVDLKMTAPELFAAYASVRSDNSLFRKNLADILNVLTERHQFPLSPEDRASLQKVFTAFYENGLNIRYIFRGSDENHATYPQLMTATDDERKNWSFLATEDNFLRVKQLQLKNLIVPIVGDFAGPRAVKTIGKYVRDNGGVVSVFYVSNVESYLFADGKWKTFYDSISTLPLAPSSVFVRTFFQGTLRECAAQRPPMMTPVLNRMMDFVRDYQRGEIRTQCDLVTRSK